MIKNAIRKAIIYIIVLCAFNIAEVFVLPDIFGMPEDKAIFLMLVFVAFLGTVLIYVHKAKKLSYYIIYSMLFIIYVFLYAIAASRLS